MKKIKQVIKENKGIIGTIVLCAAGITFGTVVSKKLMINALVGYQVTVKLPDGYEIVKIVEDIQS